MSSQHGPSHESMARLAARIPKGTWDTHMHVVDPGKFPLSKAALYKPSPHTIDDAKKFLSGLGIENMVIVQPSIYGNDNSCTLNGLKQLGLKHGRAVIQFDADTTSHEQLQEWHALGVRGVRLNFKSVGAKLEGTSLAVMLHKYAEAIKPLNWVMELYIEMEDIPLLEPIVPDLGDFKICIDHYGHPSDSAIATAQSSAVIPGLTSLANLLKLDNIWVKVSAAYRLHTDPKHPLVQSLARYILRTRPDRCVTATDWPHTRFEDVDATVYIDELINWCEAENVSTQKIFVDNAKELFDVE
jgi:predicted TIM-barrel fold metal-dependent hydrolase